MGKTHDLVTYLLMPVVFGIGIQCLDGAFYVPLLIMLGFWVGGIFLSPDLDTRSRPFYRWGPLRCIWWPYQWVAKHRSSLSHGIFWAPVFRLLYLTAVCILIYQGAQWVISNPSDHASLWQTRPEIAGFLRRHLRDFFYLGLGVWLGSLAHVVLDVATSALPFKRARR